MYLWFVILSGIYKYSLGSQVFQKGLPECFINVPQVICPILQLQCCPSKQWSACGALRKHFTKPLEHPDVLPYPPKCITFWCFCHVWFWFDFVISAAASQTTRRSPAPWSELDSRNPRVLFYEREFLEVEAISCEYNRRAFSSVVVVQRYWEFQASNI